jgi:hypothetical protein
MAENKISCEEAKILMMGLIDDEIDEKDKAHVLEHVQSCKVCASEYESFLNLKKGTSEMKLKKLPEMYWDEYWDHIYNRIERGIGWIILSLGAILILGYGFYAISHEFFMNPDKPLFLRISAGIFSVGAIILFVSVLREKLMIRSVDKYRSIKR